MTYLYMYAWEPLDILGEITGATCEHGPSCTCSEKDVEFVKSELRRFTKDFTENLKSALGGKCEHKRVSNVAVMSCAEYAQPGLLGSKKSVRIPKELRNHIMSEITSGMTKSEKTQVKKLEPDIMAMFGREIAYIKHVITEGSGPYYTVTGSTITEKPTTEEQEKEDARRESREKKQREEEKKKEEERKRKEEEKRRKEEEKRRQEEERKRLDERSKRQEERVRQEAQRQRNAARKPSGQSQPKKESWTVPKNPKINIPEIKNPFA